MDSFTVVKKAPPSLTNSKGSGALQGSETTAARIQHRATRRRHAPYSTEERVRRIQRALDDAEDDRRAVLLACSDPNVPQPLVVDLSNNTESQTSSFLSEAGAHTRHVSKDAYNECLGYHDTLDRVIKRKDVLDMKHPLNPITHSNAPRKSQNFVSCSNGHQSGRGASVQIFREMDAKLANQATATISRPTPAGSESPRPILQGLRIYVNGLVRDTTRSELARLVTTHGGLNLRVANSATHIITSMGLSGSKSQQFLKIGFKKRANLHVVRPEWLFDSINAGKRLSEYNYRIVKSEVQGELHLASRPDAN